MGLHSRDSTRLRLALLFGHNHPSVRSQKQTCMRDACIAWRPFCNTYKYYCASSIMHVVICSLPVPEATSLSACQAAECLSIWTRTWHIVLISQSGRQGNDAEIRYHCKALLAATGSSGGSITVPVWPGLACCRISDNTVSVVLARPLAYRDHKAAIAPIRRGSQSWKRVHPQIAFLLLSACICGRSEQAFTSTLLIHG